MRREYQTSLIPLFPYSDLYDRSISILLLFSESGDILFRELSLYIYILFFSYSGLAFQISLINNSPSPRKVICEMPNLPKDLVRLF